MIKAEHKTWAKYIFNIYIRREFKKYFSHFYLVNQFPVIDKNKGLIITPNHISWWDGFFIDHICKLKSERKIHIMMLEDQLNKYSFFKKLGAYSINPGDGYSVKETVKYTRKVVGDNKNFAVIYPQGEIEEFEKRPLLLKTGLKYFVHNTSIGVAVLPVGFKIHYYNQKLPSIIARFGDPIEADTVRNDFEYYESKFTENLDLLSNAASNKTFISDLLK